MKNPKLQRGKTASAAGRSRSRLQRVVSRQDVETLYDLLYVCECLYWKSDVGNRMAQTRMNELHTGKRGRQVGFFAQTRDAIDKVRYYSAC